MLYTIRLIMHKLIKAIDSLSYRKKLLVIFAISMITSLTIAIFTISVYCSRVLLKGKIDNLELITSQSAENYATRQAEIKKQVFNTINRLKIPETMIEVNQSSDRLSIRELSSKLYLMVSSSSPFDFVYLQTNSGAVVSTRDLVSDADEIQKKAESYIQGYQNNVRKEGFQWISDENNQVFLLYSVRDLDSLQQLGYVILRLKPNTLDVINSADNDISMIFISKADPCIYMILADDSLYPDALNTFSHNTSSEQYISLNGRKFYTVETDILSNGWKEIGILSLTAIQDIRQKAVIIGLLLGVITFFIGAGMVSFLTRKVSVQLDALSETINTNASGDIGRQTPIYTNDDIGKIAVEFNDMVVKNQKLMTQLVESEAQKSRAEMEALDYQYRFLQTQINPHFIYNSLEMLNAMAKISDAPEVSKMVLLLAKYFRSITQFSEQQFTSVQEELNSLQYYIDIYQIMKGPDLIVQIDYQPEVADAKIPTMILQPIIENCFVHGMRGDGELSIVRINVTLKDQMVTICISDNGKGIDSDNGGRKTMTGIGINNIKERLKILYQDDAALTITSSNEGTKVSILLPYRQE